MTRYTASVRRPVGWVSDNEPAWQDRPSIQVYEPDGGSIDTGLVNDSGVTIWRTEAREPWGFRRRG